MSIKSLYLRPHIATRPGILKLDVSVPTNSYLIGKLNSTTFKAVILNIYLHNGCLYQISYHNDKFQRSHMVGFV
jgi:hypothetical protein